MPTLSEIGNFFQDPMGSLANVQVGGEQVSAPVAPTTQQNQYQYQAPAAPSPINLANSAQLMNGQPNPAQPQPVAAVQPQSVAPTNAVMTPVMTPNRPQVPAWSDVPGQEVNNGYPNLNAITRQAGPNMAAPQVPPQQVQPQPQVPVVPTAPVAPGQNPTYNAMVQTESGGRDFGPNGQPLTSSAGAMFSGQVMPSTAANPGYGIKPAQSQTPDEYNRVGREYFDALQKRFPQEKEKAIAAYNAGEGGVRRAEEQARKHGGRWQDYLPEETKNYLLTVEQNELKQGKGAVQPVSMGTNGQVNPEIPPASTNAPGQVQHALNGNEPTPPQDQPYWDKFHSSQNDPAAMAQLSYDSTAPEAVRKAASAQHLQQLKDVKMRDEAKTKIDNVLASGNTSDFARMLKAKGDEGSYVKAYLFQRFGLNDLAKNEQQKLGAGNMWQAAMGLNGERATINYDGNGQPIQGFDEKGRALTGDELAKFAAGSIPSNKAETGADVYYDPTNKSGARFSYVRTPTGGYFREVGTQRMASPEEQAKLIKMSSAGPLEQQYMAAYLKGGGAKQGGNAAEGYTNAPLPGAPGYTGGTVQPTTPTTGTTVPATGGAVTPNAPSTPTSGPTTTGAVVQPTGTVAQQKVATAVSGKEQEAFVKDKTDFANNAGPGQEIATIRRGQINNLISDPQIIGYLANDPTSSGKFGQFIREVVAGAYDHDEGKKLADDLRTSGLPLPLQNKIQEYQQANTRINALTLKANEGPGSISNVEQRMNQNANMTNIGDLGPWSALTGLSKQQLTGDMTVAKQQFAAAHPELNTATAFQNAWAKQQQTILKGYEGIYQARLAATKPFYDMANEPKNKDNEAIQRQYRNASIAAFKTYPTPDYNPQSGRWDYRTKEAKMAAMSAIAGGQ